MKFIIHVRDKIPDEYDSHSHFVNKMHEIDPEVQSFADALECYTSKVIKPRGVVVDKARFSDASHYFIRAVPKAKGGGGNDHD